MERGHLIVFTRYPEPGKTKTRLIPALGPEGAAELQRKMAERVLARVRQLRRQCPVSVVVHFDGGDVPSMQRWLGEDLSYRRQGYGDMGMRMERAFCEAFGDGAERAVLVGTDCPALTSGALQRAFGALERSELVLGPARDGGYYLIGLVREIPHLFGDIPWGTEEVLAQTLRAAQRLGLSVELMDVLDDIDRIEDLSLVEHLL